MPHRHRHRLAGFIIDCQGDGHEAAAQFWSEALRLPRGETYQDGEARYTELTGAPDGLHVEVQQVGHPSRVHLDIEADDQDAEAERLEKLGARRIGFVKRWWVMEAPTGQRFCIVRWRDRDAAATPAAATANSRLAGFIIDCQTEDLSAASDFWSQALGLAITDKDDGGVGLYDRLQQTAGGLHVEVQKVGHASRVHLDIAARDVEAEVQRRWAPAARPACTIAGG
jgi:predicted enzyme related to lactoylglutathione lyase